MTTQHKAARFVAQLYSGKMTDRDEQALQRWLGESEHNRVEYTAALQTWDLAGDLVGRLDELEDKPARRYWPGLAVAASVLLAVAVVFVLRMPQPAVQQAPAIQSYVTATGEQQVVDLPDGSRVTLNTNTRLLIDFNGQRRRTILEYGEVFFEIAGNAAKPFMVDTGFRAVTVLGTRFDVFKSGVDLHVAVVEGQVAVHRSEDSILPGAPTVELTAEHKTLSGAGADQYRLGAGVSAQFSGVLGTDSAVIKTQPLAGVGKYPYWRAGQVRFDEQPLYEVVREINRYTQKKLLIEDSRVMDMPVSGVFNLNEIDAALDSFEVALPVQITRYPDRVVIVGSSKGF